MNYRSPFEIFLIGSNTALSILPWRLVRESNLQAEVFVEATSCPAISNVTTSSSLGARMDLCLRQPIQARFEWAFDSIIWTNHCLQARSKQNRQ